MKTKINIILILMALFQVGCASDLYYYKGKQEVYLEPLQNNTLNRSLSKYDMYQTSDGKQLGIADTLAIQFLDISNLQTYLTDYDLKIEKDLGNKIYILKTKNKSLTLQIANELALKDDVKFAEPNFYQRIEKR